MQAGVGQTLHMVMFWHRKQEPHMIHTPHAATRFPLRAHRAPDPAPFEEPPADPFEPAEPHQAPIRTPQNDEPVPDHNPSISFRLASRVALHLH
jgi:hypothetical protein